MYFILFGLFIHWFADFVEQSHWQATNKAINNKALLEHTSAYSSLWFAVMIIVYSFTGFTNVGVITMAALFAGITFVAHTVTDYFTSRWSKHFFDKKDYHNGFVVVGFDQILHYLQLYFTYKLLS